MKVEVRFIPQSGEDMGLLAEFLKSINGEQLHTPAATVVKPPTVTAAPPKPAATVPPPKPAATVPAATVPPPKPAATPPPPVATPPAESELTLDALRAKASEKMAAGHKEALKGLLKQFGNSPNVSSLGQEHWAAFSAELDKLES